jgi:predicted dehydrogenase/threonine dehydrogenase-like Zn-dependent dehydrogenase
MLVEFGRGNFIEKVRKQPDKVRQVLDKVRTDGFSATWDAVKSKLDEPVALGYCQAGVVVESGEGALDFPIGTRVVTNGPHAEFVNVPRTLAARIPDSVPFEDAAFAPLAAIALQGIRLASLTLGETVVVYGLGLIGMLSVQIARAAGCHVIGVDADQARLELARSLGAECVNAADQDVAASITALTSGVGADAVLLTLASDSNEPVSIAAQASRKRGRLVLVGVTGLNLRRDDLYKKELSFAVSCSYGPGRYDSKYEDAGVDYPLAFVRWTEQRNFEAVLRLMEQGALTPSRLVTHRVPFESARAAYDLLLSDRTALGIVLNYQSAATPAPSREASPAPVSTRRGVTARPTIGAIGAGSFGARFILPAFRNTGATLDTIVAPQGTSAALAASRLGFRHASSNVDEVLGNPSIDTVAILTRHDSHADLVCQALAHGKNVFVEKPLCLTLEEADRIESQLRVCQGRLLVGFNRRFAPLSRALRAQLDDRAAPKSVVITVNAGALPPEHWAKDIALAGGRLLGEGCHFIDLARFLAGAAITDMSIATARTREGTPIEDVSHVSLSFADGSHALVHYLANGSPKFPKERVEVFCGGSIWQIDNWRRLRVFGRGREVRGRWFAPPQKGHAEEIAAFVKAIRDDSAAPIPPVELLEVSRWAIRASMAARGAQEV